MLLAFGMFPHRMDIFDTEDGSSNTVPYSEFLRHVKIIDNVLGSEGQVINPSTFYHNNLIECKCKKLAIFYAVDIDSLFVHIQGKSYTVLDIVKSITVAKINADFIDIHFNPYLHTDRFEVIFKKEGFLANKDYLAVSNNIKVYDESLEAFKRRLLLGLGGSVKLPAIL